MGLCLLGQVEERENGLTPGKGSQKGDFSVSGKTQGARPEGLGDWSLYEQLLSFLGSVARWFTARGEERFLQRQGEGVVAVPTLGGGSYLQARPLQLAHHILERAAPHPYLGGVPEGGDEIRASRLAGEAQRVAEPRLPLPRLRHPRGQGLHIVAGYPLQGVILVWSADGEGVTAPL